jgi:hypothetical protein
VELGRCWQKPDRSDPGKKKPRPSRPGVARALTEHPDTIIAALLDACPHCAHGLSSADQSDIHAYDYIDPRKVTNCSRAEWGAKVYAAAASVIATGQLHGRTALEALMDALAGVPVIRSG